MLSTRTRRVDDEQLAQAGGLLATASTPAALQARSYFLVVHARERQVVDGVVDAKPEGRGVRLVSGAVEATCRARNAVEVKP